MIATVGDLVRDVERALPASTTPRLDAQLLVGHVLDRDRAWIIAHPEEALRSGQIGRISDLLSQRQAGMPVAYLRGHVEWFGIDLEISPEVLVPRPDTEILAEAALALARSIGAGTVADIGTGSGAVAIALALGLPSATVIASDVSDAALAVAARNVERHGVADRVRLEQSDLLAAVPDEVDLVVANLPYLSDERMDTVSADVRSEPRLALAGGADGLDLYRKLSLQIADRRLQVPVAIEIDPEQVEAVAALFYATHREVRSVRDLGGRHRVIIAIP